MALIENLKAAKALIDTPDKMDNVSCLEAIGIATDGEPNKAHAVAFIGRALLRETPAYPRNFADMAVLDHLNHADVMVLFDHAIANEAAQ